EPTPTPTEAPTTPAPTPTGGGSLPSTGAETNGPLLAGAALVALGSLLVAAVRRREGGSSGTLLHAPSLLRPGAEAGGRCPRGGARARGRIDPGEGVAALRRWHDA